MGEPHRPLRGGLTLVGTAGLRLVTIGLVTAACATAGRDGADPFHGASGPVAWEVVGIHRQVGANEREIQWTYTVILRETAGRPIEFEALTSTESAGSPRHELLAGIAEEPFRDRLEPHGELRVNGTYRIAFTSGVQAGFGELPGGREGVVVRYRFRGRDAEGQPITVLVRMPLDPGVGRRPPAASVPASLPPGGAEERPAAEEKPPPPVSTPEAAEPARPADEDTAFLREAARDCERRFPAVEGVSIDARGGVSFRYRTRDDEKGFGDCYKERSQARMSGELERAADLPSRSSVALESVGGALVVGAVLSGTRTVQLLLDTGAAKTVLKPAVLRRIGIVPAAQPVDLELLTASGERVRAPLVRLGTLSVGPFSVRDLHVGVYDVVPNLPGVDGLLGLDFLGHFQMRIDRAAGRLTLEPRPE